MFVEPWNVFQGRSSQATLSTTVGYTRFEKKTYYMRQWCKWPENLLTLIFVMPPLVYLKIKSEKQAQKFHSDDASLRRSGWCFWWVGENFSFSRTNQKYHSDLKSDGSSIWNFCAHFSDIIIRWCRKMLAVFSSYEAKHRPIMKAQFCFLTRDKGNFQNMPFAGSSVLTRIFYTGVRGTHRKAKRGSLGRKTGQNV